MDDSLPRCKKKLLSGGCPYEKGMNDKPITPQEKINLVVKMLETILEVNGPPGYDQIISDEQREVAFKGLVVEIDVVIMGHLIRVLKSALTRVENDSNTIKFLMQMQERSREHFKKHYEIKKRVKADPNKKKAYVIAAKELGWTEGKRTPNYELLEEYLELIGCFFPELQKLYEGKMIKRIGKKEAIEYLRNKYKIQSYDATYQELKRAKKSLIKKLKAENKDFMYLNRALPPNYLPGKTSI